MKIKSLDDLFVHELKDLYSAEKQMVQGLQKLAKKASREELRNAFEQHLEETRGQVERLEKIFEGLDWSPRGEKCEGMAGLIQEAEGVMEDTEDTDVLDAALIAAAQKQEHYEISGYGTARTYAQMLGNQEAARILQQTLDEESAADERLNKLAEGMVNWEALKG
ncbi:MAG TPA: ferritin-like domain-containing protein [Longimicrobiaceae bacterium]|nr:ferritin-like domain-containing protein [Longimicrobiaceae bacterium]